MSPAAPVTLFRIVRDLLVMLACLCVITATLTLVTGSLLPTERTVRIEQPADVVPVPTPSCPPGIEGC
jgi:hypothetical protein